MTVVERPGTGVCQELTAPAPPDGEADAREAFRRYARPRVVELLAAVGLDVAHERVEGDFLFYRDDEGTEVRVLDLLGGYGASLFGHNHPELVARARDALAASRPFIAQASVRGRAGVLARRLSQLVGESTGRQYVVTLGNSAPRWSKPRSSTLSSRRGSAAARRPRACGRARCSRASTSKPARRDVHRLR